MSLAGRFNRLLNDFEAMTRRVSADPARGRGSRKLDWPKALEAFAWFLTGYATEAYEESDADLGGGTDAVRVTTIHQAKGLEWPLVFLPALVNRRFPTKARASEHPRLLDSALFDAARYAGDESARKRILYVGLTRARDGLFVSWFTEARGKRSRFLDPVVKSMAPSAAAKDTIVPPDPNRRAAEPGIETYSPTELNLWRRCPYRYRLTRAWGFQAGLEPELGYGRANHHVLRSLADRAREGARPTQQLVDRELEAGFYLPYAPAGMRDDMREDAGAKLRSFVDRHGADFGKTIGAESRLEFPVGGSIVQGSVDLILSDPDGLEVRDYKTGEEDEQVDESEFQVRLYSAGLRRCGTPVARASIANLETGLRPVGVSTAELEAAEREAASLIASIQAGRFPARPGPACARCDFARICRFATIPSTCNSRVTEHPRARKKPRRR
jgi:DNA helicase-2/ATP-dependent DNA helicase PcrA